MTNETPPQETNDEAHNSTFTDKDDARTADDRESPEHAAPVKRLGYGRLQAAIWRNKPRDGSTTYSVTFRRSYTNAGGQWCDSLSFGRDDLLPLAKLMDEAHSAIYELQRQARQRIDYGRAQPPRGGSSGGDAGGSPNLPERVSNASEEDEIPAEGPSNVVPLRNARELTRTR